VALWSFVCGGGAAVFREGQEKQPREEAKKRSSIEPKSGE